MSFSRTLRAHQACAPGLQLGGPCLVARTEKDLSGAGDLYHEVQASSSPLLVPVDEHLVEEEGQPLLIPVEVVSPTITGCVRSGP